MKQKLPRELKGLLDFYLIQRNNPPAEFSYAAGVLDKPFFFTLKDLQRHLNNPLLRPEWVHLKNKGEMIKLDNAFMFKIVQGRKLHFMDKTLIDDEINKGCALVLEGLDILDSDINAFVGRLDESLPCAMATSVAFFSQKQNEAYEGHCDSDDVLVIQLEGKKVWQLFKPQQRRYMGIENQSDEKLGPVQHEVQMRPGDALYVRAGVPHRCYTPGPYSLHMSFDLLDRTPDVEQISKEATQQYYHACELPYEAPSRVLDRYAAILTSPEFQTAVEEETRFVREEITKFRQNIGRACAVKSLNKFI